MGDPAPLLPKHTWTPPRPLRRVVNGIVYVNKPGCQWRLQPKAFGPQETVCGSCRRWRRAGVRERVRTELRQVERQCQGRLVEPSAAVIMQG